MTNPYFAYSLKQEYNQKVKSDSSSPPSEPVRAKKARACDACSIRKTKCDNGRPCRQCVNNNLECSELRERKKPGPRSIRRKTINSINTLRNSSESPDNLLLQVDFKNSSLPDLNLVMSELAQYSPDWFSSCVPYTTYTMASEIQVLIPSLGEDPVINAANSLRLYSKRYAVMTLLLVLLTVAKTQENASRIDILITTVQRHVSCMSQVCNDFIFFEKNTGGFDVHYYLLLSDLHMFSYMQLRSPQSTHNFIRLKSAASHYHVLCAERGELSASLNEIRFFLSLWERHGALFLVDSSYRHSGFAIASTELTGTLAFSSFGFLEAYHDMLKTMDLEGVFKHGVPDLFAFEPKHGLGYTEVEFQHIATRLQSNIQASCQYIKKPADLAMCHLLGLGIRFKLLVMSAVGASASFLYKETLGIVDSVNLVLTGLPDDNIRSWLTKLSSVSSLLEILEYFLLITVDKELESMVVDSLIQFSGYINLYLDKESEVWVKRPVISNWFQKLYMTEQ